MKRLYIIASLVISSTYASAQSAPQPFKKANIIIVETTDRPSKALKTIGGLLVAQGYSIQKLDTVFNTLVTDPRVFSGGVATSQATLTVSASADPQSKLRISGQMKATVGDIMRDVEVSYQGGDKTVLMQTFRSAEAAAKAYPGGAVSYEKR